MPSQNTDLPISIHLAWAMLTDVQRMRDWMPGIDEISTEDGQPLREGSVLTFRARGATHRSEVEVYKPESMMTLVARQGRFSARYTYSLAPEGPDRCRYTLEVACQGSGLMALVAPILGLIVWRTDRPQLERFKAIVARANAES